MKIPRSYPQILTLQCELMPWDLHFTDPTPSNSDTEGPGTLRHTTFVISAVKTPTLSKGVISLEVSAPVLPALTSIADLARSNSISRAAVFTGLVNWSTQASDVPCDKEGWSDHHQLSTD